jgi:hypothetical protein
LSAKLSKPAKKGDRTSVSTEDHCAASLPERGAIGGAVVAGSRLDGDTDPGNQRDLGWLHHRVGDVEAWVTDHHNGRKLAEARRLGSRATARRRATLRSFFLERVTVLSVDPGAVR